MRYEVNGREVSQAEYDEARAEWFAARREGRRPKGIYSISEHIGAEAIRRELDLKPLADRVLAVLLWICVPAIVLSGGLLIAIQFVK